MAASARAYGNMLAKIYGVPALASQTVVSAQLPVPALYALPPVAPVQAQAPVATPEVDAGPSVAAEAVTAVPPAYSPAPGPAPAPAPAGAPGGGGSALPDEATWTTDDDEAVAALLGAYVMELV